MSASASTKKKTIRHETKRVAANPTPLRILAAVDGSECTGRVVKYLLNLYSRHQAVEIVLLNTQPEPQDWRMRGYGWFHRQAVHDRLINDLGKRVVASAGRHLEAAGVAYKGRIELGDPTETIVRCSREENCDLILLAEPTPGVFRKWLMRTAGVTIGSVASIVIHFAPVPVVVIANTHVTGERDLLCK